MTSAVESKRTISPLSPPGRRPRKPLLLGGLALLIAVGGGAWLVSHWGVEETDNAQLQAHLVEIASRVPGTM